MATHIMRIQVDAYQILKKASDDSGVSMSEIMSTLIRTHLTPDKKIRHFIRTVEIES